MSEREAISKNVSTLIEIEKASVEILEAINRDTANLIDKHNQKIAQSMSENVSQMIKLHKQQIDTLTELKQIANWDF